MKQILNPERVKLEDLPAAIEKWIDQVRMYERHKDASGQRCVIADDIKVSTLESMVPAELEKHMQLNHHKFSTVEKTLAS